MNIEGTTARGLLSKLKAQCTVDLSDGGKCSECGECCSNILPMTREEIERIGKYVKYKQIKPVNHKPAFVMGDVIDMTCPFLDTTKPNHKCLIYSVRPEICRSFFCHSAAQGSVADIPYETLRQMIPVHVRETYFDG